MDASPLKRIAAIHDLSGMGKCSLTVALPVISASGVECSCLPTALLSTHTGEFKDYTFLDLSAEMLPISKHWAKEGAKFDAVYSGYLASPEQAKLLEAVIDTISNEETLAVIDPVMADNGEYYSKFDAEMCRAFRRLCAKADIVTPNVTEAAFLTGIPYEPPPHRGEYIDALIDGLFKLGAKTAALTGVNPGGMIGVAARSANGGFTYSAMRPERKGVFYGTGDLFCSSFAALLTRGARLEDALDTAVSLVDDSIAISEARGAKRRFGVDFERALSAYIPRVEGLFSRRRL